jgi:hypothetical protein
MQIVTGEKLRRYTATRPAQAITRTTLEAVRVPGPRGLRGGWWGDLGKVVATPANNLPGSRQPQVMGHFHSESSNRCSSRTVVAGNPATRI